MSSAEKMCQAVADLLSVSQGDNLGDAFKISTAVTKPSKVNGLGPVLEAIVE